MKQTFIVLCGQIVGSGALFETVYSFDGQMFGDRAAAIAHGFTLRRSDDFNIGALERGKLVSFGWMEDDSPMDPDELDYLAKSAGLAR